MPRFYIDPPAGDFITLTGEDARHICRSLRMSAGETLVLCDGAGNDYNGVLRQADGQTATVEILSRHPSQTEPSVFIRLFQALPKGDKMEWILQKAVELGASEIVPVLTERCISRPDEKSMDKKLARWQKIAVEASKQCGRGRIPAVCPLCIGEDGKGVIFLRKGRPAIKRVPARSGKTDRDFCGCRRRLFPGRSALGPRVRSGLCQSGEPDFAM